MSNPAPLESAPAEEAPDPSIAEAERRLRLLKELTEIGMELARALKPCAEADEAASGKDPAAAFAPLSRAIRLTLALEARTCQELRDLQAGVARAREEERVQAAKHASDAADKAREAREDRVRDLVLNVAERECEDMDAFDNIYEALKERLEEDEAYEDCGDRPFRETVERLCKDLELTPDWSRWDGEGWIVEDPPARWRCSVFHQPSSKPLLRDDDLPTQTPPSRQSVHALE
jgi:rubrerythrin